LVKFKICVLTTAWQQRNNKHFLQIYFIFARVCKFQGLLEEGSKDADVKGKFVLNIDGLFALIIIALETDR
jgi:hypothetical protein